MTCTDCGGIAGQCICGVACKQLGAIGAQLRAQAQAWINQAGLAQQLGQGLQNWLPQPAPCEHRPAEQLSSDSIVCASCGCQLISGKALAAMGYRKRSAEVHTRYDVRASQLADTCQRLEDENAQLAKLAYRLKNDATCHCGAPAKDCARDAHVMRRPR